jgi:hypothetical protein
LKLSRADGAKVALFRSHLTRVTLDLLPFVLYGFICTMPARRTVKATRSVFTLKMELDTCAHPVVEAQLKRLKLASRSLHEQLFSIGAEARVLERLYYKSKNQHRSATFFAKASEVRRYTTRVIDVGFAEVIDNLRMSFYGEASQRKCVIIIHEALCCH